MGAEMEGPKYLGQGVGTDSVLTKTRFPSNPIIIRVPFSQYSAFNKETPKLKGEKGTTGVPRTYQGILLANIPASTLGLDFAGH